MRGKPPRRPGLVITPRERTLTPVRTNRRLLQLAAVATMALAGLAVSAGAASAAAPTQAAPAVYTTATVTVSEGGSKYSIMQMSGVLKPGLSAPTKSSTLVSPMLSINQCNEDGSFSVSVCGWIYYDWTTNSQGTGYAQLTSVQNEAHPPRQPGPALQHNVHPRSQRPLSHWLQWPAKQSCNPYDPRPSEFERLHLDEHILVGLSASVQHAFELVSTRPGSRMAARYLYLSPHADGEGR